MYFYSQKELKNIIYYFLASLLDLFQKIINYKIIFEYYFNNNKYSNINRKYFILTNSTIGILR